MAKTTVTFDTDTGAILDADIEVNHAYNESCTKGSCVRADCPTNTTCSSNGSTLGGCK